jgi:uncharacterized protein with GYD domain
VPAEIVVEPVARNEAGSDAAGDRLELALANQRADLVLGAAKLEGHLGDGERCGPVHDRSIARPPGDGGRLDRAAGGEEDRGRAPKREVARMPLYLSRFSYTPETWARLIESPEDRREAARSYIESVGGKLHGFWYAFGAHEGYNLWEAPDNVSMAAVALAIGGGGALSSFETTVLLEVEETIEALRKAGQIHYRPPAV